MSSLDKRFRVKGFQAFYSMNYHALIKHYPDSFDDWFREPIQETLIPLAKKLQKDSKKEKKFISKRGEKFLSDCWCYMLTFTMHAKKEAVNFDQLVGKLYRFDQTNALLLSDILFGIVFDPRFNLLVHRDISVTPEFWSFFFGRVKVSSLRKNPFFLKLFAVQCICVNTNPRQRLLTTSGFVNILIRNLLRLKPDAQNQKLFEKSSRILLFK